MKRGSGKHARHCKKTRSKRRLIRLLFVFIFAVSSLYVINYFYNMNKVENEKDNLLNNVEVEKQEVTETKTERMLQVEELQKENSEIIGWLEIEGTSINYPVCQTVNNDYYLKHDYEKKNSQLGAIFMDKDVDLNKPSNNFLIYGHRSKSGLMFEDLIKYSKEDFYKQHQTIRFTTTSEDAVYKIISIFYSRVYYKSEKDVFRYYYFTNAENENDFNDYVQKCKKASIYDIETSATYGDQLLTLSTCEYSRENGRFAVVARKQ